MVILRSALAVTLACGIVYPLGADKSSNVSVKVKDEKHHPRDKTPGDKIGAGLGSGVTFVTWAALTYFLSGRLKDEKLIAWAFLSIIPAWIGGSAVQNITAGYIDLHTEHKNQKTH